MANKSNQSSNPKKPGRSIKEKRAAKHAKQEANNTVRKTWDK
jgi:hypothetical protein